jgi:membrane protein
MSATVDPAQTQNLPAADGPREHSKPSFKAVLQRSRREFRNKNLTTLAAALTYYGVLATVPGLIVLFTVLGLLGRRVSTNVAQQVNSVAPGSSGHFVQTLLSQAQSHKSGTGAMAIVGVLIALWSASSYVNAFRQTSNIIYEIGEGRPIWMTVPVRLAVTAVAVIALVVCAVIVVVSGSIANTVGNLMGAGHTAVVIWDIVKWPVLLVVVSALLAVLFWASPNAKQAGFKWVSPGGVVATVAWLVLSGLFAVYVTNFSSYSKNYGPLAGLVIFLIWLWLSNVALLLGAEINAELDHERAIAAGLPPDLTPFVQPRDTRKLTEHDKQAVREAEVVRRA